VLDPPFVQLGQVPGSGTEVVVVMKDDEPRRTATEQITRSTQDSARFAPPPWALSTVQIRADRASHLALGTVKMWRCRQ
jgi:hypothetical protein